LSFFHCFLYNFWQRALQFDHRLWSAVGHKGPECSEAAQVWSAALASMGLRMRASLNSFFGRAEGLLPRARSGIPTRSRQLRVAKSLFLCRHERLLIIIGFCVDFVSWLLDHYHHSFTSPGHLGGRPKHVRVATGPHVPSQSHARLLPARRDREGCIALSSSLSAALCGRHRRLFDRE
jgi:hypothetical protein